MCIDQKLKNINVLSSHRKIKEKDRKNTFDRLYKIQRGNKHERKERVLQRLNDYNRKFFCYRDRKEKITTYKT